MTTEERKRAIGERWRKSADGLPDFVCKELDAAVAEALAAQAEQLNDHFQNNLSNNNRAHDNRVLQYEEKLDKATVELARKEQDYATALAAVRMVYRKTGSRLVSDAVAAAYEDAALTAGSIDYSNCLDKGSVRELAKNRIRERAAEKAKEQRPTFTEAFRAAADIEAETPIKIGHGADSRVEAPEGPALTFRDIHWSLQ